MINVVFCSRSHGSHIVVCEEVMWWDAICLEEGWAGANCSLFAVSPYFQPLRSNYLLSVRYPLPPQTSGSRNLNCKLIDAGRLKTTQSCPTTRQNNMKRSRRLTREEVGVKGVGRPCTKCYFLLWHLFWFLSCSYRPHRRCALFIFSTISLEENKLDFPGTSSTRNLLVAHINCFAKMKFLNL